MTQTQRCPRCLTQLPARSPLRGLCPKCLLALASEEDAGVAREGIGLEAPSIQELSQLFPELELLGPIGRGGMGAVFKARQRELGRLVALKLLLVDPAQDPAIAERFLREARALAALDHPGIVRVYSSGVRERWLYLILEYVDGVNVRQAISGGGLVPREVLAIVSEICSALDYAHAQGVVHRDIKPENVLITKLGRVKIADFGLAKIFGANQEVEAERLTRSAEAMGTPHYMAPEQIEHPLSVDHRADIYSLGVVLYELLTGELPLGRFAPPSQRVQIDVRLDEVVLRTLEKEPKQRYQRASEVKLDLDRIAHEPQAAGGEVRAKLKPGPFTAEGLRGWGWYGRPSGSCCGCLVLFVILLLLAYLFLFPVSVGPG